LTRLATIALDIMPSLYHCLWFQCLPQLYLKHFCSNTFHFHKETQVLIEIRIVSYWINTLPESIEYWIELKSWYCPSLAYYPIKPDQVTKVPYKKKRFWCLSEHNLIPTIFAMKFYTWGNVSISTHLVSSIDTHWKLYHISGIDTFGIVSPIIID